MRAFWLSLGAVLGCWALGGVACAPGEFETPKAPPGGMSPAPSAAMPEPTPTGVSFAQDVEFLSRHTRVVVLRSPDGDARVAVAPEYQGRVMTSTASGETGPSFGWIHRPVIARRERQPHMTVLGGEDRFWLGPEGGQFGLYFPPGAPFTFEHWQVPEPLDWGAFEVRRESSREIVFHKAMELQNHSGARFSLGVERTVRLLDRSALELPELGDADVVGFETENVVTNTGSTGWNAETGLISIWILGMFTPSDATTVVMPIRDGDDGELGPPVRDDYFGSVPADRLVVRGGHVFFRGDGKERGKIGIPRPRARPVAGSYDATRGVLTLVRFTLPDSAVEYVDSRWEHQSAPYAGDVSNSYNDGPPAPGAAPLGPFYELESSSPALALAPGQSYRHEHRTLHVTGNPETLDGIAQSSLGVTLDAIRHAFAPSADE